jgi:hypothetical protein
MSGFHRLIQALVAQPGLERQVRRRAGNRCEGWIEDPQMRRAAQRCTKRGAAVDLYLSFRGWLGDVITAGDIGLFCEACYDRSEAAEGFAHFDHMVSKTTEVRASTCLYSAASLEPRSLSAVCHRASGSTPSSLALTIGSLC